MKINEIFKSIQGETTYQGLPSLFIRTTGCNLRCNWCDTVYAYDEGIDYPVEDLLKIVDKYNCKHVVITGGEPLIQEETPLLVSKLLGKGYTVLLETNGSMDLSLLHPDTVKILDIKCPGSGMSDKMLWDNMDYLSLKDEVKFVISDYGDYTWAKAVVDRFGLSEKCKVLLSPVFQTLSPQDLAQWIIYDNLPFRLQLQIHKYIWNKEQRGI